MYPDSRNGGWAEADGATTSAVISIAMNTATERRVLMLDNLARQRLGSQGNPCSALRGAGPGGWQTVRR